MGIVNFPAMLRLPLPRDGENIFVHPAEVGVVVYGINSSRGFGWHVGNYPTWPDAMTAARQHQAEEIELARAMRAHSRRGRILEVGGGA